MTDLLRRDLELSASPEEVWRALTDPSWLEAWLADEASLELWPGGDARFVVDGRELTGWVEEVLPPPGDGRSGAVARLSFWWAADDEPASRVELEVIATDPGTRLRVVETRPLEVLDLIGVPLPGQGGTRFGPALIAA